jgi:large subunit ribosomal protein L35
MKSRRNARDRFKVTATGKVVRRRSYAGHIMTKKSPKRKRHLRSTTLVDPADAKRVKRMLLVG